MKKALLTGAFAGLLMSSCKKDHTCECVDSSNFPGYPNETSTVTFKAKKKDAENACNALNDNWTTTDPFSGTTYNYKTECKLK